MAEFDVENPNLEEILSVDAADNDTPVEGVSLTDESTDVISEHTEASESLEGEQVSAAEAAGGETEAAEAGSANVVSEKASSKKKKKKRRRRRRRRSKNRRRKPQSRPFPPAIQLLILISTIVFGALAIYLGIRVFNTVSPAFTDQGEYEVSEEETAESDSASGIVEEPELVDETEDVTHLPARMEEEVLISVTSVNAEYLLDHVDCSISGGMVRFKGIMNALPYSDDEKLYLFNMHVWEDEIPADRAPVAVTEKAHEVEFTCDVNENQADSRLYDKFQAAVKLEGEYVPVGARRYISNPEQLAGYTAPFKEPKSIKGLLVDPMKLAGGELSDLGVKQAIYNIPLSTVCGPTSNGAYPTINYTYNGRNYQFNGQRIHEFDYAFSTICNKGITLTAVVLNDRSSYSQLIHPQSRGGSGRYYAFNAADEEGTRCLEAVTAFLAARYRDGSHGLVSNWIIGNEVNVREWNYMQYVDLHTYAREYADAFRVMYTAIKSMNANARVYISLDQQWDRNRDENSFYDGRNLMDAFAAYLRKEGDIDWNVGFHPYSVPLTWPKFWNLQGKYASLVTHSADTSMICMANLEVLTNYLQREELLNPEGKVRRVLLSEMGYTSSYGEDVQAAAFAYSYFIADKNPYVDGMLFSRQTDASVEVSQGLSLGLSSAGGQRRKLYHVFKQIDTANAEEATAFALPIIGKSSWAEALR